MEMASECKWYSSNGSLESMWFSMAELLCVCLSVCKIGTRIVSFDLIFFTLHVITVDIIFFIGGMNSRNSFQSC